MKKEAKYLWIGLFAAVCLLLVPSAKNNAAVIKKTRPAVNSHHTVAQKNMRLSFPGIIYIEM